MLEGLWRGAGWERRRDHRCGDVFGGVSVRGVEGGVGAGHVQSDAFMLQDIDTWGSCGQREEGETERENENSLEKSIYMRVEL